MITKAGCGDLNTLLGTNPPAALPLSFGPAHPSATPTTSSAMDSADSTSLQQFAAAATHQFSGFGNDHDDSASHQDAVNAGAAVYAPVDSLNASHTQSHPMNLSSSS